MAIEQSTIAGSIADRWWVPLIRGVAAILFGVLALAFPALSLMVLLVMWGVYAIVDGVFALAMAVRRGRSGEQWGWLVFEGLVGIAAGVLAFVWPGMTALILLWVIAGWAILTGVASIASAIRLRKEIEGEWLLAASGVLSILFGALLFFYPGAGALAVVGLIGVYAIIAGVLLLGLAWRLYTWHRDHSSGTGSRYISGGGMPRESSAMP